jgi:hypothetical protein
VRHRRAARGLGCRRRRSPCRSGRRRRRRRRNVGRLPRLIAARHLRSPQVRTEQHGDDHGQQGAQFTAILLPGNELPRSELFSCRADQREAQEPSLRGAIESSAKLESRAIAPKRRAPETSLDILLNGSRVDALGVRSRLPSQAHALPPVPARPKTAPRHQRECGCCPNGPSVLHATECARKDSRTQADGCPRSCRKTCAPPPTRDTRLKPRTCP